MKVKLLEFMELFEKSIFSEVGSQIVFFIKKGLKKEVYFY